MGNFEIRASNFVLVATIAALLLHLEGAPRCEALACELLRLCDEERRNG